MSDRLLYPLTAYQRDIWFSDTLLPESPQFSIALRERFSGNIDLAALKAAVKDVLARHDAFRIRFGSADGEPYQWLEPEEPQLTVVDFRAGTDAEAARAARADERRTVRLPVLGERLYEAVLLRTSDTEAHFHLTAHHLISDGWSLHEVRKQIRARYAEIRRGEKAADFTAPSFVDFIDEDTRYRASASCTRDRQFLNSTLSGAEPRLFGRKNAAPSLGHRTSFVIEGDVVDRILAGGNSPFSVIAAAFGTCLARMHRTDDVILGIPMLNRHSAEERQVLGPFTNVLPLRVAADGGRSMTELAQQVRGRVRELQEHQRVPLADVLRDRFPADVGRLFDVTISYLDFPAPPSVPGVSVHTSLELELLESNVLAIVVQAHGDTSEMGVDLVYAADVFGDDLPITEVVQAVRTLIRQGLDEPDRPVDALPAPADVPDQSPLRAETWPMSRTCPFSLPPDYAGLREHPGLPRVTGPSGRTVFVAARHDDVRAVLGDARFSSDRSHPDFPWMRVGETVFPGFRPSLIEMDPPEHGPARRAVAGEFAIRRMRELDPKVQRIVDGLLDDVLAGAKPADLVSALAVPMSGLVLCELLGIPTSDRQEFTTNTTVLTAHDAADADRAESFRSLIAYFGALCATKMTERPEDLLGRLAGHQLFSGDESRWAMVELCILLVVAGLETTATMTALGVLALLEHPDQLALLTADPGLTPAAVEELLRFFTVAELSLIRRATADIEIGGTLVRTGEGVAALSAAANRDPAVFADPDTFDITRDNRKHLAFGSGPHQCLGKNLARLELRIVLDTLFRRIPTLRLATPRDELRYVNGSAFSVSALPVTW